MTIDRNWIENFVRVGGNGYPALAVGNPLADTDDDGLADDWENETYQPENLEDLKPSDPYANHTGWTVLDEYLHRMINSSSELTPKSRRASSDLNQSTSSRVTIS